MPLRVRLLEQKFYSQLRNGENFNLNLSDFTTSLSGNVGDKIKVVAKYDIAWYTEVSTSYAVTISGGNTLVNPNGNFLNDGFNLGDSIIILQSGDPTPSWTANVTYIDANTMILDASLPAGNSTTLNNPVNDRIIGTTILEGVNYDYNIIENNTTTSFSSLINNQSQSFFASGVYTSGVGNPVILEPLNNLTNRVWINGSAQAEYLQTSAFVQEYQIEHEFIILPYYLDGYLNNINNNTNPLLYDGASTTKYVSRAVFKDTISNPNSDKSVTTDDRLGSVGFFNENKNGFPSDFNLISIDYGTFDGLNARGSTPIVIRVGSNTSTFIVGQNYNLGVSKLTDSTDFNTNEDYETNFLYEVLNDEIGTGANGTIIQNLATTIISGNEIEITADIVYNGTQQLSIDGNDNFALWVGIGSDGLTNLTDDRVNLLAGYGLYDFDKDVAGLLEFDKGGFNFYNHPYGLESLGSNGFTSINGFIEDGYLVNVSFDVEAQYQARIENISFKVGAYNPTTDDFFNIQEYEFNLTSSTLIPVPSTIFQEQNININTDRGFQLANNDQFNFVKLETLGTSLGGQTTYNLFLGFKINYEEWLSNPNVNNIFFDNTKPNNNKNLLTSNYSDENGYEIRCALDVDVSNPNQQPTPQDLASLTTYRLLSPTCDMRYYRADGEPTKNDPQVVQCTIETFSSDQTNNAQGNILTGDDTFIRATFSKIDGSSLLQDDAPYAVGCIRFEEENGNINQIHELSTFRDTDSNNPLKPLPLESYCKISYLASNKIVTLECLIDKDKVNAGSTYKISARLWLSVLPPPAIIKLREQSGKPILPKFTEDGLQKKLD